SGYLRFHYSLIDNITIIQSVSTMYTFCFLHNIFLVYIIIPWFVLIVIPKVFISLIIFSSVSTYITSSGIISRIGCPCYIFFPRFYSHFITDKSNFQTAFYIVPPISFNSLSIITFPPPLVVYLHNTPVTRVNTSTYDIVI